MLIADDHPLFREALTCIVETSFESAQISHAIDYDDALDKLSVKTIDWLFLDLNMPGANGLSTLAAIRKSYSDVATVVVSANESEEIIRACIDLKVAGYIKKSTESAEMEASIKRIIQGEVSIPELSSESQKDSSPSDMEGISRLTAAQLKIFTHIGEGKLNKQIAIDLGITEHTVKAHVTQIYKKLGITNRTQAALLASKAHLFDYDEGD